jgi:hypothetical protein
LTAEEVRALALEVMQRHLRGCPKSLNIERDGAT